MLRGKKSHGKGKQKDEKGNAQERREKNLEAGFLSL